MFEWRRERLFPPYRGPELQALHADAQDCHESNSDRQNRPSHTRDAAF
jgi:hypothetical protein